MQSPVINSAVPEFFKPAITPDPPTRAAVPNVILKPGPALVKVNLLSKYIFSNCNKIPNLGQLCEDCPWLLTCLSHHTVESHKYFSSVTLFYR